MWETPDNVQSRESQPPFPKRRQRAFCPQLQSLAPSHRTASLGILNRSAQREQRKTAASNKLPVARSRWLATRHWPLTTYSLSVSPLHSALCISHFHSLPSNSPSISSALSCSNNSTHLFSTSYNNSN